ncbi:cache domain-containing protein [Candidatus Dependentiae bacterium]|nr:cache domain-containing protein [Candidatus Dependentiae bacterium]
MKKIFLILSLSHFFCYSEIEQKVIKSSNDVKKLEATFPLREVLDVDLSQKVRQAEKFVSDAVNFFNSNSIIKSCNVFLNNDNWKIGDLFISVIDENGNCLCHGDDRSLIWKNFQEYKNIDGDPLIQDMLTLGDTGGWIVYLWDNAYRWAYSKVTTKNKKKYIISTGFFPENKEFTVRQLVLSAANDFYVLGAQPTFIEIDNTVGKFIKGDIYLGAVDMEGNIFAHGDNPALVGQNRYDIKDSAGRYIYREMIKVAKERGAGWVEYDRNGVPKRSYVRRIEDPKTKKTYLIFGGYYPTVTADTVIEFVRKAVSHLKTNGMDVAFKDFSNKVGDFAKGSLTIFVYDLEGKNLANGAYPSFVGQNLLSKKDPEGKFVTKMIIEEAQKFEKGWITFTEKNDYQNVYVELVDAPDGKFVVGSGFYPSSKQQFVKAFVESAAVYLRGSPYEEAFRDFTKTKGDFVRGDVRVFVYDEDGNCFVNGSRYSMIWDNFIKAKDQDGNTIIDTIVATGKSGGAWVSYKTRNATRRVYVKGVEKEFDGKPKTFIVGSGYFL